ncbi:MAG TPA: glycosyltransferase family 4 protein [Bacteroidota bacterium]
MVRTLDGAVTGGGGVCIFGPRVARVFSGEVKGGAELQMALLAQALTAGGIRCVIVDPQAGDAPGEPPGSPRVVPVPGWNTGIRGLRMLTRRWPRLLRALRTARSSLYYARGFSSLSAVPWLAARLNGVPFVLAVASDADLLPFRDRFESLYRGRSGLWDWISTIIPNELVLAFLQRSADALLVQHDDQASLAERAGLRTVICRNIAGSDLVDGAGCGRHEGPVTMVGTLSRYKGLDLLPDLIRALPELTFEFIGRVTDADGVMARRVLAALPNVKFSGALPRAETLRRIAEARVLLNTSPREGFPNTFLEAWAFGTPVISLHVDPGGVLERERLGICCHGDVDRLAGELRKPGYDLDPERMRAYVRDHHSGAAAVAVLRQLIPQELRRENHARTTGQED